MESSTPRQINREHRVPKFMTGFLNSIKRPNLSLVLLVVINLVIGLFTFQDYGPSWDEPLFYKYADALGYAYSLQPRLDGAFDITNSYGPSGDHAMYGPAYLLLGRNFVYLFENLTGLERGILWHAVNFVFYQISLIFFYLLCRRWVSNWAAFAATLLYSSQPLLWGHAFINPKDLPFSVFFILAVYGGLRFVDKIKGPRVDLPGVGDTEKSRWLRRQKTWATIFPILITLACILLFLDPLIRTGLRGIMAQIYQADPASLMGRAFRAVAEDAGKVDVDYYAGQLIHFYAIIRIVSLFILLPLGAIAAAWRFTPDRSTRFWRGARASLHDIVFWERGTSFWSVARKALLPGILLGLVISVRVMGPFAGLLAVIYFLLANNRRSAGAMLIYGVVALLTTYLTWPFLWSDPVGNFRQALQYMSFFPDSHQVLFGGVTYSSLDLPASYLPTLLGITLTEPVLPLALAGLAIAALRMWQEKMEWRDFVVILAWFGLPFLYVVLTRPPMYDGYRHFLFILAPIFITTGLFFQWISEWKWLPRIRWVLLTLLALPGILGIGSMHPYEYAFYNSYVGGPSGAFRRYDADFWLTCYKEALQQIDQEAQGTERVFVPLQVALAQQSARDKTSILKYDAADYQPQSGDYFLLTSRFNRDRQVWPATEPAWTVGRRGAQYCVVKRVP